MTPEEGAAVLAAAPIYRFPVTFERRPLGMYGFDWEIQPDGSTKLLYRAESDITPMHILTDYGRAYFNKYGEPHRAEWVALADRALWGVNKTYADPYGEAFGASCAVLFTNGPVPLLSFFKTPGLADEVKAFILGLAPVLAPNGPPMASGPTPRVLLQNSHRQTGRADGWSGAPGEAQYICDMLNPRIVAALAGYGIETVIVDGDMVFHPAYSEDYLCFIAPHYDADIYGEGGWFWGRAQNSPTYIEDDRLGVIFQKHYLGLAGVPAQHQERMNVNVTDYYAFRWTTDKTPGFLVELGVGWGPDKDWLRANVDHIAQTFADSVAAFAGIQEEPMTREQFDQWFAENYAKYDVAATFDALKAVDAKQQAEIDQKADVSELSVSGLTATATVTFK